MTLILHVQGTRSASSTARPTDELDSADQQVASNVFGTGIETSMKNYDVILGTNCTRARNAERLRRVLNLPLDPRKPPWCPSHWYSLVTAGLLWLIPDPGGENRVSPPTARVTIRVGLLIPLSLNSLQARTQSSSSDCATLPASHILLEDSPSHFSWFSTLSFACISTWVLCIRALSIICHRYCQSYAHESFRKPYTITT